MPRKKKVESASRETPKHKSSRWIGATIIVGVELEDDTSSFSDFATAVQAAVSAVSEFDPIVQLEVE